MRNERQVPPSSELFAWREMPRRHPTLFNEHRIKWAMRNRKANGLEDAGVIYETQAGEIFLHEPGFIGWFLGLQGKNKPRASASRRSRR